MTISGLAYSGYPDTVDITKQFITAVVRYHPVTIGPVTGDLRITGDFIDSPLDVPLTGTGIYGTSIPVTEKDYDTDLKALLLNQYRTR